MKKVAIIFGGKSSEHDISKVSGTSIIKNLDKSKYIIYPVYVSRDGLYYKYNKNVSDIKVLNINDEVDNLVLIENIIDYLKEVDVVFPVMHGKNGEDGTIQGLLELIGIPYVGCKVLSSSLCMDKVYTKIILKFSGIEQSKSMYIRKFKNNYKYIDNNFNEIILSIEELIDKVGNYLNFPVFIKPSNSGSSVGINKSLDKQDFQKYLEEAFYYDEKVLIEETIIGREVECAVVGNEEIVVSNIGEVLASGEFYSFDSKYKNKESKTVIPANIDEEITKKIKNIAKRAYRACDCDGLSRIDFFIEDKTNRIILNEINTMPGFTEISMYPKLMNNVGINYSNLLDTLIDLAK